MDTFPGWENRPITLNKYLYGNADPVNHIDPSGHFGINSLMTAINTMARLTTTAVRAVGSGTARTVLNFGKAFVHGPRAAIYRAQYMSRVKGLRKIAAQMRANGKSSEEIARVVHSKRRALGRLFKNVTDPKTREAAFARNQAKYGDKWGPTINYLRSRGKSWEEIIESAARPNSSFVELAKIFFSR